MACLEWLDVSWTLVAVGLRCAVQGTLTRACACRERILELSSLLRVRVLLIGDFRIVERGRAPGAGPARRWATSRRGKTKERADPVVARARARTHLAETRRTAGSVCGGVFFDRTPGLLTLHCVRGCVHHRGLSKEATCSVLEPAAARAPPPPGRPAGRVPRRGSRPVPSGLPARPRGRR